MSAMSTLKALIPETLRQSLREVQVGLSFIHVSGPRKVALSPNDAAVTCVVKNGEFYLTQFLEHYLGLGFKHIYLLDNGSTDDTVKQATRFRNVTVYRSTLPVGKYQGLLKKRLVEMAVPAGWCLDVDIDEFFDYPYSNVLSLDQLLDYLNVRGYSAVITQMLDMFSDRPLSSLAERQAENLRHVHRYYDISNITKVGYFEDPLSVAYGQKNAISSSETALFWGGIRKTIYGINCLLTKHSLFRAGIGLQLFAHNHYVNKARLADVSCLLLHYKFASNATADAAQNRLAFMANSHGYSRILEAIDKRPDVRIKSEEAREYRLSGDLLDSGLLFASDDYRSLVRKAGEHTES